MSDLTDLTAVEQDALLAQEARIEQGMRLFFWEIGDALAAIQEHRLYRPHGTFEEYCKSRWRFGANYARKLIRASQAIANLKSANVNVADLPTSEGQTRELSRLKGDPIAQAQAWLNAIGEATGSPTQQQVREAVDQVQRRCLLPIGATAKVVRGKHQGQTVTVRKTENGGAIAYAQLPTGEKYPFLAGELEVVADQGSPAVSAKPKTSLKEENSQLKTFLKRVLSVATELPVDLRLEALKYLDT